MNSAVIHLRGFLLLLATVRLWNLLHHNPRLQVIGRTLSKAWDEMVGFMLVILILLTGYVIAVSPRFSVCLFLSAVVLESRSKRPLYGKSSVQVGNEFWKKCSGVRKQVLVGDPHLISSMT